MHAVGTSSAATPFTPSFDGPVDHGIEHRGDEVVRDAERARTSRAGGGLLDLGAEALAHALLRLVADHPGHMGRMRAGRVVGGFSVPCRDEDERERLERYAVDAGWTIRELVRLVDATISGGLVAQTVGPRPVLVLTRAGYQALAALEGGRA